jgi:uncharacterized protein (TIGR00266 family)
MATFTVTGEVDPFLHVALQQGDVIYAESNAMVMMEDVLDLESSMGQGGLFGAIVRRIATDESFFLQKIVATRGNGDLLLSHSVTGQVELLDVGPVQYILTDGAFLACSGQVSLKPAMQGISHALFGDTGGFVVLRTEGSGKIALAGFGSTFFLDVQPGRPVLIDNQHVVAWDTRLTYELAVSTTQSGGFLREAVSAATSGEGVILRFSGQGKVLVCSRNRKHFLQWVHDGLPEKRST